MTVLGDVWLKDEGLNLGQSAKRPRGRHRPDDLRRYPALRPSPTYGFAAASRQRAARRPAHSASGAPPCAPSPWVRAAICLELAARQAWRFRGCLRGVPVTNRGWRGQPMRNSSSPGFDPAGYPDGSSASAGHRRYPKYPSPGRASLGFLRLADPRLRASPPQPSGSNTPAYPGPGLLRPRWADGPAAG